MVVVRALKALTGLRASWVRLEAHLAQSLPDKMEFTELRNSA
jgi:hypothetical protein